MRPYILAETNWNHLKDEHIELAVLPWGATEAHNYHLPYATDVIEADRLAAESARIAWEQGAKVMVLPTVPFGVNTGQPDIYLDINLNPSTQSAILQDVIEVLSRQNIKKLLVFNSHGGNSFKTILRELGLKHPDMFLSSSSWFKAMEKSNYFEKESDHAGEMETSLILHFRPDLVLPRNKWGSGSEKKHKITAFQEDWLWSERKWSEISEDTGVGDPSKASKKKGERFYKDVTQKIGKVFIELCELDTGNMYE